ncbi:PREDICTED: fas-associated death domain protein [Polistes dominula]|uniref:Fas-associated death domain protein n=1 Tax=Polistes dominula TaxID=743375 RepID=A0ABM1JC62_POLDO|nr:PREDICTED: fas-associated death domain protein [Polistes dominula]XP_015190051.1 PREDICTED: fas-associated death domain protein [Polistes dominula]
MTVQVKYKDLIEEFVKISKPCVSFENLEEIKNEYSYDIGSKRKISGIQNLEGLIKVLEKYTILAYDDIKPLYYIEKRYIKKSDLITKLKNYEDWYKLMNYPSYYNMYQNDNARSLPKNNHHETCDRRVSLNSLPENSGLNSHNLRLQETPKQLSQTLNNKESKLKQIVVLKVSEQLGRSWRDVCRFMNLKEYQIDELENKYPCNLKEQCNKALHICISQNNSEWKMSLLHALEKGRRKDVKEVVEKILLRNEI